MTRSHFLARLFAAFAGMFVASTLVAGSAIAAGAGDAVALRWALGSLEGGSGTPTAISKDTQLKKGAKLKFLVEPLSPCSVYLLLLDSSDEISVLYRKAAQPSGKAADGKPTYVPDGSRWFELDEKAGMETFFLLASKEPLAGLESLLDKYVAPAADAAAKKKLGAEIVAEVRRLQKENRNFARPVEKPVMIGGRTRGDDPAAIERLATEVTAERFYDKTITIEH